MHSTTAPEVHDVEQNVTVRPVEPADWFALRELLQGLSPHAKYMRFLRPVPDVPDWAVDALCRSDDRHQIARIAITRAGTAAGVGQYFVHPSDPTAAEVAVTIAAAHQRRGLGRQLLQELASEAVRADIDVFTYVASPQNQPALGLMRSLGARSRFDGGLIEGSVPVQLVRQSRSVQPQPVPRRGMQSLVEPTKHGPSRSVQTTNRPHSDHTWGVWAGTRSHERRAENWA